MSLPLQHLQSQSSLCFSETKTLPLNLCHSMVLLWWHAAGSILIFFNCFRSSAVSVLLSLEIFWWNFGTLIDFTIKSYECVLLREQVAFIWVEISNLHWCLHESQGANLGVRCKRYKKHGNIGYVSVNATHWIWNIKEEFQVLKPGLVCPERKYDKMTAFLESWHVSARGNITVVRWCASNCVTLLPPQIVIKTKAHTLSKIFNKQEIVKKQHRLVAQSFCQGTIEPLHSLWQQLWLIFSTGNLTYL